MPSQEIEQKVESLNQLIGSELGFIAGAWPTFAWKWSESLITTMQMTDIEGKPQFDYVCGCGVNVDKHRKGSPTATLVGVKTAGKRRRKYSCFTTARAVTGRVLIAPNIVNKWVLCRWLRPPTEAAWKQSFGSMEDYPRNGTYVPVASNETQMALKDGVVPDERTTWIVIQTIKTAIPNEQVMAEKKAADDRKEERAVFGPRGEVLSRPHQNSDWWNRKHELQDAMTTFGQTPGAKGGVSYPASGKSLIEKAS